MSIMVSPVLFMALLGAVLTTDTAPAPPIDADSPCLLAAHVVSGALVGDPTADLPSWPLYEIELNVLPKSRDLVGRMQVSFFSPAAGLESVTLLLPPPEDLEGASPLTVGRARVRLGTVGELEATTFHQSGVRLEVRLPRATLSGEVLTLFLELKGRLVLREPGSLAESMGSLAGGSRGIERVGAIATDGTGVTLLGAHPVLATYVEDSFLDASGVAWGPAHSSPPACHIMSVVAPSGLVPASTGLSVGQVPEPDGHVRHTFVAAGARRMGVVLRSSDVSRHERRVGRVTIRATAREAEVAREMTGWARGVLRHYERSFGAYPWTTLEIVEAPMTGSIAGLRAPGLVLVNEMVTGDSSSLAALGGSEATSFIREIAVAHQIAHQWFGELLDVGGVESPAIEEALAWYAVLDYARSRHGADAARRIRDRIVNLSYHAWRFAGGADSPAGASLKDIMELGGLAAYMGLCDGKAPGLMEALAETIGRQNLRTALLTFTSSARFGRSDRGSLEDTIRAAAPNEHADSVTLLFSRWLDETHGDEDLGNPMEALSRAITEEFGGAMGLDSSSARKMMEEILKALGGLKGP